MENMEKIQLPQLTQEELKAVLDALSAEVFENAVKKGAGIFVDDAQIDGRIQSELREFQRAIDARTSEQEKFDELLDIAATALWGAATVAKRLRS